MNKSNARQIANKKHRERVAPTSGLALLPLTAKISRVSRVSSTVKLSPLRAFKCANNRDFPFYAMINRGLLVPSREFTSTVTYKLAGVVLPFSARFARRVRRRQAYYNVTVTFYVARNSDTAWYRVCEGISIGFHRGCCVHLDKQVLLPLFLLPGPGLLVYVTSRSKRPCRLCLTIGNGYDVCAIYANR